MFSLICDIKMEVDLYIRIKNFLTCLSHIIKQYKYLDDFDPKGNIILYNNKCSGKLFWETSNNRTK